MQLTSDNFTAEVLQSDIPVLVDFYADWCGPCKMLSPIVAGLETAFAGKVKVGKLNVDHAPDIAEKYNVMSIPTVMIVKGGEVVWQHVGLLSKAALEEQLNNVAQ